MSRYSRIILMPGEAAPWAAATSAAVQPPAVSPAPPGTGPGMGPGTGPSGGPLGRPPFQRRVMPDGRVVTSMDDGQSDDNEDNTPPTQPGLMRPPYGAPSRVQQGQAADDSAQADDPQGPASAAAQKPSPAAGASILVPGALPAVKRIPSTPIKPPGD